MNTIIEFITGKKIGTDILSYQIQYAFKVPDWLVFFLIIMAGVYSFWVYGREADFVKPYLRKVLGLLRFIVYTLMILAILRPTLLMDHLVEPKSNLAIMIDATESMGIVEKGADADYLAEVKKVVGDAKDLQVHDLTRTQVVEHIFNNRELGLFEELSKKFSLHFFYFGKELRKAEFQEVSGQTEYKIPEATDAVTQLGSGQRDILNYFKDQPFAGMVVFTDGGNNRGENPLVVAQGLKEVNVPIFPVGVGFPESVDIAIKEINVSELLFKDEEVAIEVIFKASSLEGVKVPISVMLDDKEIAKSEVICQNDFFRKEIVIKPTEMGKKKLTVSVPGQLNEFFLDNNKLTKEVTIVDSKIRILIAVDNPSWEYRYLKGMLNTDERISTKVFIRKGDIRRARHDEEFIYPFPKTREELHKNYDVIIFNNIFANAFTTAQLDAIKSFVSEDGGAFIMFSATSGTPATYRNTVVEDMLPVFFSEISQDLEEDKSKKFSTGFRLRLTKDGKYHNITRLTPLVEENEKLWLTLPQHYWYYSGIDRLKPGAISLVEHDFAGNVHGPTPLIAQQRYGKGQVLFFGVNSMWRWRYKIGNKYFNKFWAQTIQFMGLPHLMGSLERVQYTTESKEYTEGEMIPLMVKVLTPEFTPIQNPDINLIATNRDTNKEESFKFAVTPAKPGTYEGQMFLKSGEWEIKVEGFESEAKLNLMIKKSIVEFENPSMHKSLLTNIAHASGGEFIELNMLSKLKDMIAEKIQKTRQTNEWALWDNWVLLLLITFFASVEWLIRKKVDLP